MDEIILSKLNSIEKMLTEQTYLEVSHSHLYKMTSSGTVPFYKPNGKKLYFKRGELDAWLLSNRSSSKDEIEQQAADYLIKKGRVML